MRWQSLHPGPPAWSAGARKLRLRPSVCFCSITAPGARGARLTRLYSAGEESPFGCTFLLPVCPPLSPPYLSLWTCSVTRGAVRLLRLPANIFVMQQWPGWAEVLSCGSLRPHRGKWEQAVRHQTSVSRNRSVLSWSSSCVWEHSQPRHHLCWQLRHQPRNTGICWCLFLPLSKLSHPHSLHPPQVSPSGVPQGSLLGHR